MPPASAVKMRPSFSASGRPGLTSSSTAPPCTFTASGTNSPARASLTDRATWVPAFSWASAVLAPRCGVATTAGISSSGLPVAGSAANTSMAAPATRPSRKASASACSSTMPPRAAFTMRTPGLTRCSSFSPSRPIVSAFFGRCTVMKSASPSSSSRLASRTPSWAARAGGT